MDWQAIWETIKLLKYVIKVNDYGKYISYFFNYYFSKPTNVIIFGISGAGKSEFIRSLLEQKVGLVSEPRTRFNIEKRFTLKNGEKIRFYDVPGHSSSKQQRQEMIELIAKKKIKGIINVTTYGYNDVEEAKDISIFKVGDSNPPIVKSEYLNKNRLRELEQTKEWIDFITSTNRIEWVITVVNKADVWYREKREVLDYYESGTYYENFTKSIERVCKTCVFPYCSILSPFANKPMILDFSERDKVKLHKDLKDNVLKLINKKYEN